MILNLHRFKLNTSFCYNIYLILSVSIRQRATFTNIVEHSVNHSLVNHSIEYNKSYIITYS